MFSVLHISSTLASDAALWLQLSDGVGEGVVAVEYAVDSLLLCCCCCCSSDTGGALKNCLGPCLNLGELQLSSESDGRHPSE